MTVMDFLAASVLFGAGLAGGIANAIAGGATLITFPAMLAAGLPPLVANASNAVAVTPGHLVAAVADRGHWPPLDMRLMSTLVAAFVGGVIGAILLFATPERFFVLLVPALIALATLIFAFGKSLRQLLPKGARQTSRSWVILPTAIYGGYFGAGLGVMLLAVLTVTGDENARTANALKNLLATAVSMTTIVIFTIAGLVSWRETFILMMGAIAGGFLGGRLLAILPPAIVRVIVIAIGIAMTLIYAARYWT